MATASTRIQAATDAARRGLTIARYHQSLEHNPILVYTMGKVGSMALERSLPLATGRPAAHFHAMTSKGYRSALEAPGRLPRGYLHGRYFQFRTKLPTRTRWEIVTVVRDPLARVLSAFFQVGERFGWLNPQDLPTAATLAQLADKFVDFYWSEGIADWFVEEFEPATAVDVYKHDPPHAAATVIETDRFRVLLLRAEDLPEHGPGALQAFFGTEAPFDLERRNAAADKGYATLYRELQRSLRLPPDLVEHAYSSRQARHMYTAPELVSFRQRWTTVDPRPT